MRTHQQLLDEIAVRRSLGLPRIELTAEERARAYGDTHWANHDDHRHVLAQRLRDGLPMSLSDKRRARQFLKEMV